ncbi:hypothetical protein CHLNCDRAFT_140837 [Chlorella variabilis]|uniref:Peptidyl-prolyl cis-trans isomerase CYP38-like PsbQ-like domain-containing protein n=1 Tax=Chlorella variabilis TaxID=554065 RepID=E1Z6B4_CHLVA|nr:hypothetical protein CHLNCDRAFT_140837 [Chlorella variabilis]EFN58901.1 hypothetical protein CHLNCDRAFT_140837 [Chlorella variabilis]|eukprot:XP_005851003.1 hypothetical protein CHLNCDRAFT_140837 [Chlorella variabilis]
MPVQTLRQLAKTATGVATAAMLALGSVAPLPAAAVLNSPIASVPRSADVALRRSIPAFNQDVRTVQSRLEAIGFKLRIPQRKPWQSMAEDTATAAALAADQQLMMAGVLPGDEAQAEELLAELRVQLDRLARSIEAKNPDRTSVRVANALEEAPGLPYQLPRQLTDYPALAGRAVVELTVEKASGERVFVDQNSDAGPQKRAKLQLVLDGYSAPITAANLAANFSAGLYNGLPLSVNGVSVLAGTPAPEAEDSAFDEDARDAPSGLKAPSSLEVGTSGGDVGGRRMAPTALPLEILAAGDFEPVYRSTLDVRSGELPVLPLSIYGAGKLLQAVAMAHLPDSSGSGYAGLAGLSFDEGEFGVCGYVTKGLDALSKLEDGDRIVKAKVVSGLDKLT